MSLIEVRRLGKTPRIKIHYLAIDHLLGGKNKVDIARYLKVTRGSLNKWVNTYLEFGTHGLKDISPLRRPSKLTASQIEKITAYVINIRLLITEAVYKH